VASLRGQKQLIDPLPSLPITVLQPDMTPTIFVVTGTHCLTRRSVMSLPVMSHSVVALYVLVLHVLVLHVLALHAVILRLSVLHDIPLTVCDVDHEPVTQRRYCDPVKRRQASQKVTDCVRHEARGVSRL